MDKLPLKLNVSVDARTIADLAPALDKVSAYLRSGAQLPVTNLIIYAGAAFTVRVEPVEQLTTKEITDRIERAVIDFMRPDYQGEFKLGPFIVVVDKEPT